ncbi:MAG: hypothetical protein ACI93R_003870, partial [Flavobacteriales bacterium]
MRYYTGFSHFLALTYFLDRCFNSLRYRMGWTLIAAKEITHDNGH